ncbi:MAG: VanZ family protein [Roseburia sp.]|nr:VanZ family protein [Roseburia sp.]MCM1099333.1 VanZ family protein [Ruminococcus flavefaciens]MCM1235608.1 VanZ family protein [Ruminococcus flavefaciens]
MLEYIYRDLSLSLRWLPAGLAIGVPLSCAAVGFLNRRRRKEGKEPLPWPPTVIFGIYLAVLGVITFLSRESGSGSGRIDLKLFSTWGINNRNNAFVIENVLLFIPYGFLYCWNFPKTGGIRRAALLGAATSLGIETVQLLTGRGFFQLDDIVTNTLGAFLGGLLFAGVRKAGRLLAGKGEKRG